MGFHMGFAGTMAAFAAGVFRLFFFARDAFEVGVLVETEPNVGVTGFAYRAADEVAGRVLSESGRRQRGEEQEFGKQTRKTFKDPSSQTGDRRL